jgi:hypothetical protein
MFNRVPSWATEIISNQEKIMASIAQVLAADAALKADIISLSGLVTQLITAFAALANGSLSPAQAQQLLTDLQGDDTTVDSAAAAISTTLNPTAPAPSTPAPTTSSSPTTA